MSAILIVQIPPPYYTVENKILGFFFDSRSSEGTVDLLVHKFGKLLTDHVTKCYK